MFLFILVLLVFPIVDKAMFFFLLRILQSFLNIYIYIFISFLLRNKIKCGIPNEIIKFIKASVISAALSHKFIIAIPSGDWRC